MKFRLVAALSVLALSCVVASAAEPSDPGPYPFAAIHPSGYPAHLLGWGIQYAGVFTIGPEVEYVNLTVKPDTANLRTPEDEFKFFTGKLRYASYLNNLCGGTSCTVVANIRAYTSQNHKKDGSLIVRMTLNGSSSYMESYLYKGRDGMLYVYSRAESGWLTKMGTPAEPSFLAISEAALLLVGKDAYRSR